MVGAGIAAGRSPRPWLWVRVAGDALDLALLGVALARHPARRGRALTATAAVAAITATDIGTRGGRARTPICPHPDDGTGRGPVARSGLPDMTTAAPHRTGRGWASSGEPHATRGSRLLRTTDPKDIRILYLVTSF